MANHFEGANEAKVFEKGIKFTLGFSGVGIPTKIVHVNGHGGKFYVVEFKVMESNHAADPVGSTRSWVQGMSQKGVAFNAIKVFLGATQGLTSAEEIAREITEDVMNTSVDETTNEVFKENPIRIDVVGIATAKSRLEDAKMGKPEGTTKSFPLHIFKPV